MTVRDVPTGQRGRTTHACIISAFLEGKGGGLNPSPPILLFLFGSEQTHGTSCLGAKENQTIHL